MGSEQGMGWNWIVNLASFCELHVISEGEYRSQVEAATHWSDSIEGKDAVNDYGLTRQQCENLHFYWVPIGGEDPELCDKVRRMCWNQGDWRFYLYYKYWQQMAADEAIRICRTQQIDVLHQLNMVGFREPGMLYKVNERRLADGLPRIPIVWGPFAGFGSVPSNYVWNGGVKFAAFYSVKNILNLLQLKYHGRVCKMLKTCDALISATPDMQNGLRKYHGIDTLLIPETGCHLASEEVWEKSFSPEGHFRLLWVGRFIYTKQLDIALRTMAFLRDVAGIELHIVGKGVNANIDSEMRQRAKKYGVEQMCHWHGQIPNARVHQLMRQSDLFFFTSIFEATSTVLLESIANRLPFLCFDLCGFGPIVKDKGIGMTIPCQKSNRAAVEFARVIRMLCQDRALVREMSDRCVPAQLSLSWRAKAEQLIAIYQKIQSVD